MSPMVVQVAVVRIQCTSTSKFFTTANSSVTCYEIATKFSPQSRWDARGIWCCAWNFGKEQRAVTQKGSFPLNIVFVLFLLRCLELICALVPEH
jgi:hypothetical protein